MTCVLCDRNPVGGDVFCRVHQPVEPLDEPITAEEEDRRMNAYEGLFGWVDDPWDDAAERLDEMRRDR